MTMSNPIFFNPLLILMNLYQHENNQDFSFYSKDIFALKILHSDWPRAYLGNYNVPKVRFVKVYNN